MLACDDVSLLRAMHLLGPIPLDDKEKTQQYAKDLKLLMPMDNINFDVKHNEDSNKYFIEINQLKNIRFLYRKLDQFSWQYCNKGFFNFV